MTSPCVSGPLACGLRDVAAELLGPDAVTRALSRVDADTKARYETLTAVEWVPIKTMETVFGELAKETGTTVGMLHEKVAVISIERTMRTFWRLLLRLTTDNALISRTPVIFAKSYDHGRLEAVIPEPGRGEITLHDWLDVPEWPLRATRIGVQTVLSIAGRKDVRVQCRRSNTGASYLATWR